MRKRKRRAVCRHDVLAALAIAAGGCAPVLGLDGLRIESRADAPDASAPCAKKTIPAPLPSAASGGAIEFLVAANELDLGDRDRGGGADFRTKGYDLDGKCTGLGEGPSCVAPSWAEDAFGDGPGGVDNANGHNTFLTTPMGQTTDSTNGAIALGVAVGLYRVRGYNGESSDDQVEVSYFVASTSSDPDPEGKNLGPLPKWDGLDSWYIYHETLELGRGSEPYSVDRPMYVAAGAYVSDWTLVAHFEKLQVPLGVMSRVFVTGTLVPADDGGFTLHEGTLAGRIEADSLLHEFDSYPDPDVPGAKMCRDSQDYPIWKASLCSYVDISYTRADDGTAPCDALSWAWTFETVPAGNIVAPAALTDHLIDLCALAGRPSPADDSCSR